MKKISRVSAFFLTLALLLGLLPLGVLAADAKATTLRLEDTEGTVTVANARGKTLSTKSGTKLYNGYSVATSASSYAWISLDDDVVVKLDASSKATVKQDGKKLEVQLESGNLLFNVSEPLDSNASLDIRTSSMSTGVRGTAGLVSVAERSESSVNAAGETVYTYVAASRLVILEGTVTLTYNNAPISGESTAEPEVATAQVASGWQADVRKTTSVIGQGAEASATTDVKAEVQPVSIKETLLSSGYAAVEVASDTALRDRITEAANDLDKAAVEEIVKEAETVLKEEQKKAEEHLLEMEKEIEKALEQAKEEMKQEAAIPSAVIPVFPPATPPNSGSSHSDPTPAPSPTPVPSPEPTGPTHWLVSFYYNGALYATQSVAMDPASAAQKPKLQPTKNGEWQLNGAAFDFSQTVTSDLTLTWKAA